MISRASGAYPSEVFSLDLAKGPGRTQIAG
jgi:hypothetical protein